MPINVRGEGDTAELGNQISGMLVALHIDDRRPSRAVACHLERRVEDGGRAAPASSEDLPRRAARARPDALSRRRQGLSAFANLFDHVPMANLMISSVPGPPHPALAERTPGRVGRALGPAGRGVLAQHHGARIRASTWSSDCLGAPSGWSDLATLRDYIVDEATALIARHPPSGVGVARARRLQSMYHADVAQLVERDLAKVEVAGSSPVVRSKKSSPTSTVVATIRGGSPLTARSGECPRPRSLAPVGPTLASGDACRPG